MATTTKFSCFANSERAAKAISRIEAKRYDVDSWNLLVKEAGHMNIETVDSFYEELVATFPTCGRFWKAYIDHEMKSRRFDKVAKLFQRTLEEVLTIDIYKSYLNYVQEVKASEPELILKAFRYTLDKIGIDPNAISIYQDYIKFLKEREVDSTYLEGQKNNAIIKAYQEVVVIPLFHVDTLWKEFKSFVQTINPGLFDKVSKTNNCESNHTKANNVAKELAAQIRGLNRAWPAAPPTFSSEELKQVEIWRRYIEWEKKDPLKCDRKSTFIHRVSYAYKQCLLSFGHHPNFWHEYATFLDQQIKSLNGTEADMKKSLVREQTVLFERAIKGLMKENLFIHFSYADLAEARNDKKKALDIYNNLIETHKDNEHMDLTLVYIQLLRFTRRIEGFKPAKAIFDRARDDKRCSHQIYTAAALMEYHCTKKHDYACKIFERGLKKFNTCPDFILSYIQFMNSLNEENNTRVLFERVLTTCSLQPKDTAEIWNSFLEFEAGIGDASSITKVEKRRAAALRDEFPDCRDASWAVDKYKFQDLFPCSVNELRSLGYQEQQYSTQSRALRQILASIGGYPGDPLQQQANGNGGNGISVTSSGVTGSKFSSKYKTTNGLGNQTTMANEIDQVDGEADFSITVLNSTNMCTPDLDQMIPFKPVIAPAYGAHTVPGGEFPPPPAVGSLLNRLPRAGTFWGPFVDVEEVCGILRMCDFDELFEKMVEHQRRETNQNRPQRLNKRPRME